MSSDKTPPVNWWKIMDMQGNIYGYVDMVVADLDDLPYINFGHILLSVDEVVVSTQQVMVSVSNLDFEPSEVTICQDCGVLCETDSAEWGADKEPVCGSCYLAAEDEMNNMDRVNDLALHTPFGGFEGDPEFMLYSSRCECYND